VSGTELSAENEFGALLSCEKPTGGNHFEYSEVHVLQLSLIRQYIVTASIRHPAKAGSPPVNPPLPFSRKKREVPKLAIVLCRFHLLSATTGTGCPSHFLAAIVLGNIILLPLPA